MRLSLKTALRHSPVPGRVIHSNHLDVPYKQIYVMYDDNEPLPPEKLATARLVLRPSATLSNGQTRTLPDIVVPKQGDYLSQSNYVQDELISWMERQAEDSEYRAFRTSGVYHFRVSYADRYNDGQV